MDMSMDYDALGPLFELSRDAVVGVKDNRICFANPAAGALFGIQAGGEASPTFPPELFDGSHERASAVLTVAGKPAELSLRRSDGVYLLCLRPAGAPKPDRELLAQLRTVYSFSDSLMTLRMALDALARHSRTDGSGRAEGYAAILYREYYRLQRLCAHISTAANIARGALPCSLRTVDLEAAVRELVRSVQKFSAPVGIILSFQCSPGDYFTETDEELLELLLLNLLANRLAHCPAGCALQIGLSRSGHRFVLSVDDDGPGLSGGELAGALSGSAPFNTQDGKHGEGLDLFIAKGIAERLGGSLLMESGGKGTHIRVTLPCRTPENLELHKAVRKYEARGMNSILTELSGVLPSELYRTQLFD